MSGLIKAEDIERALKFTPAINVDSKFSTEQWEVFFKELAKTGVVMKACRAAGIGNDSVYYHARRSPDFELRMRICREIGAESLEEEAYNRAVDGVDTGVYYEGRLVAKEKKYSDALLTLLLQGAKPDKYRNRTTVDLNNSNHRPLEQCSDEELEAIIMRKGR